MTPQRARAEKLTIVTLGGIWMLLTGAVVLTTVAFMQDAEAQRVAGSTLVSIDGARPGMIQWW